METWRKIFLRAAGFGAGAIVTAAVVMGAFIWWSKRPEKPKPWNSSAITASFEEIHTEGETKTMVFVYTLQNNTDVDYQVQDDSSIHLGATLQRSKAFSFDKSEFLKTDYPIYVPAKSRVRFKLHVHYPYPIGEDLAASDDVRHDWETKICKFANDQLSNLSGFVLMDEHSRFQVIMPNGWTERGEEPLRTNAVSGPQNQ
jgi:hypothetical protein